MSVPRKTLSRRQRVDVLHAGGGVCYLCGEIINLARAKMGEARPLEVEHPHMLALGGHDTPDNRRPAHDECHAIKTKRDMAALAKTRRLEAKREGRAPKKFKRLIPGSKQHWAQRGVNGSVIVRASGRVIKEGFK